MGKRWVVKALDRGAVLFIGIGVGLVLGLSLRTGGKPLRALLDDAPNALPADLPATAIPDRPALPAPPRACGSTFPRSARVEAALAEGRTLHIGVFGDSFGDGVFAATEQAFRRFPKVAVHKFSHEGTGFTRYRSTDLLADARARIAAQPVDIALIAIGANDTMGLYVDGHAAPFMGPGWQKTVGGRIGDLVHLFEQRGVAVGWIGLPRMRDADFDRDIQAINTFQARTACSLHVPFADAVPLTQDRQRRFSLRLVDPVTGKDYLARAQDGKHMTFHGYEVISRPMLQPILALLQPQQPPRPAATSAPEPAKPAPDKTPKRSEPAPRPRPTDEAITRDHVTAPDAKPSPRPSPSPSATATPTPKPTASSTEMSTGLGRHRDKR